MSTDDYIANDYSYDYPAIDESRVFTIIIATISALFPLSVVIILMQRYNTLVLGKTLVHYVLCIAMADTMYSLFVAFGFPRGDTVACSIQGFAVLLFSRFSWFYTDVLIVQLFNVVVFKQYFLSIKYMHGIVFSLNLLLQLLPFTTGVRYGVDDDGIPTGSCNMIGDGDGKHDAAFWIQYTVSIESLMSFILIIVLSLVIVYFSLRTSTTSETYLAPRIKDSWSLVILYPLAMLVSWVPAQICAFYINHALNTGPTFHIHIWVIYNYLLAISTLYGPLLSVVFYTKTLDARRAWLSNLRYIFRMITNDTEVNKNDTEEDNDVRCSSIISIDDRLIEVRGTNIRMSSLWNRNSDQSISGNYIVNPLKNSISINDSNDRDTSATIRIPEA